MRKIIVIIFLSTLMLTAFGKQQATNKLILIADLNNLKEQPFKAVIERVNLGEYSSKKDTIKITGSTFKYETQLLEPEFLKIVFYWQDKKLTSIAFWAISSTYQFVFNNDLEPSILNVDQLGFSAKIKGLAQQVAKFKVVADSLVGNVSYENQAIAMVEQKIGAIRDSIDQVIDTQVYRNTLLSNLDSPLGLYALCKYSERPYTNQRVKWQAEEIERLLNKLDANLRQMPSAKILLEKLNLGRQMAIGKVFKVVALPDTNGKMVKLSSFRGKYVLIDFWASWCTPCRAENPTLVKFFKQYKTAGFQIVGISRDKKSAKTNWLAAIEKDHINIWPQLSDFNDLAAITYGIRFLPTNYLIDPKGIIIARDLSGDDLAKELKKIFKY